MRLYQSVTLGACVSMCVYQYVDVRVYQCVCVGQSASVIQCV